MLAWADTLAVLWRIHCTGELPFTPRQVVKVLDLPTGKPIHPDDAQAAALRLVAFLQARYYPLASVSWDTDPDAAGDIVLTYAIDPGVQGRLRHLGFTGNEDVPSAVLEDLLSVHARHGFLARWLGRDILQVDAIAADQERLQTFYQHSGYLDARIDPAVLTWDPRIDGYKLTWPIMEGGLYRFGEIIVESDLSPPDKMLDAIVGSLSGQAALYAAIGNARDQFATYFMERGHAFTRVDVRMEQVAEALALNLVFEIEAGEPVALRHVMIAGNTRTAERVVRREVRVETGDRFDVRQLRAAQEQLAALPVFAEIGLDYLSVEDAPLYDLLVRVKEGNTGRVELAYLYDQEKGGAVQIAVRELNLALSPPFRGQALQTEVSVTFGPKIRRGDFLLRNPRLGLSHWNTDFAVFHEDSRYVSDLYNQRSFGGSWMFGHPVGSRQLISTGYAVTGYDLYDVDAELSKVLLAGISDLVVSSWIASWSIDLTDRSFRPTRGVRVRAGAHVASQGLGGNVDVVQPRLSGAAFWSPFGNHVTILRGAYETTDPYGKTDETPLPLRLYLGGTSDLRGFGYNSVTPLGPDGLPLGGQTAWWATLEHLVPVGSRLDLAVYADIGDVSLDAYAGKGGGPVSNWGLGILIRADNFPARFDLAFPLQTMEGDDVNKVGSGRVSFSVGYRY